MSQRFLFVAVEVGAVRYLEPLWIRWLTENDNSNWRVILGNQAAKYIEDSGLVDTLPILTTGSEWTEDVTRAVLEFAPTSLVISAGDHHPLEETAIHFGRLQNIPTAQFIDSWYGYRRRFAYESGWTVADEIFVIDERAKREGVADGLPSDRLTIIGHPSWENSPRLPAAPRDHVLFLGAPVKFNYGRDLGYDEEDSWNVVLEARKLRPDLFEKLWYGKHPLQAGIDRSNVEPAILSQDSMTTLANAGTVLGMFSAPLVDAFLNNRLVVSVQPNFTSSDFCPLSRHQHIRRVATAPELVAAMLEEPGDTSELANNLSCSTDRLERWLKKEVVPTPRPEAFRT